MKDGVRKDKYGDQWSTCPECGNEQPDMGQGVKCEECGHGSFRPILYCTPPKGPLVVVRPELHAPFPHPYHKVCHQEVGGFVDQIPEKVGQDRQPYPKKKKRQHIETSGNDQSTTGHKTKG